MNLYHYITKKAVLLVTGSELYYTPLLMIKPFIKWAGTKAELVPRILDELQPYLDRGHYQRLIEPFAGSCAVAQNVQTHCYFVADTNPDLVNLYQWLKQAGPGFISDCQELFELGGSYCNTSEKEKCRFLYEARRQTFNDTALGDYWRSLLFVYLNRHSYNGLCTYDADGQFNVPYGMYRNPHFPSAEMKAFHQWAQHTEFVHADFRSTMAKAQPGDIIYCDPPNLPLTTIDGVVSPIDKNFTMQDHLDLATVAKQLSEQGIPVFISNLDTPEARELYKFAQVDTFPVRRYIQDKGGARGKVWEIVAVFNG